MIPQKTIDFGDARLIDRTAWVISDNEKMLIVSALKAYLPKMEKKIHRIINNRYNNGNCKWMEKERIARCEKDDVLKMIEDLNYGRSKRFYYIS